VTTRKTAQLLEYGASQQPAARWIRRAFLANARVAIETIERETVSAVARVAAKLGAANKGK